MKTTKDFHRIKNNYMNPCTLSNSLLFDIRTASSKLQGVIRRTPLEYCKELSDTFGAEIYLKREDLQITNSYKIRGAYCAMSSLFEDKKSRLKKVVCASAGNHSQGVAYVCHLLGIGGIIYMPKSTPSIKVSKTKNYGGDLVDIILEGDCFDDAEKSAKTYASKYNIPYIHPFNDNHVIEGQGTVGYEILQDFENIGSIDMILVPIGGGGLVSGIIQACKNEGKDVKIIGVQPEGASSMKLSLNKNTPIVLEKTDIFIDGASVKSPGDISFGICSQYGLEVLTVTNIQVINATHALHTYSIFAELAGGMGVAALETLRGRIYGKKIVVVISGGNYDASKL